MSTKQSVAERPSLTAKQERFCREYLVDLNATQAFIRAGFSAKSAGVCAAQMLKKPSISSRVAELTREKISSNDLTLERIAREIRNLSLSDARNYFTWGPNGVTLKDSSELTDDQAACVSSVRQVITKDGGTIELKLWDKNSALEKAGKYLGMFADERKPEDQQQPPVVVLVLPGATQPQANGHAAVAEIQSAPRIIDVKSQS